MQIILPDYSTTGATSSYPFLNVIDTSAGVLVFNPSNGTIVFNGTVICTPPSISLWYYIQLKVTLAQQQGASQISFFTAGQNPFITPTSSSDITGPATGGLITINGGFFQNSPVVWMDSGPIGGGGSALPITQATGVTFVNSGEITVTIPATTAGTYVLSLMNPDNSYTSIDIVTS